MNPVTLRSGAAVALVAPALLACSPVERPVEPFCDTLEALAHAKVDLPADRNELAGHVASLEALLAVAPAAAVDDLETLRDVLAQARDASGVGGFLVFRALTDPVPRAV